MWCYSKFRWGHTMKIINGCSRDPPPPPCPLLVLLQIYLSLLEAPHLRQPSDAAPDYGWLLLWQWERQSKLHQHLWCMPPSFEFLPFNPNNTTISDCYNGLILCWCLGANGYRYVVYNPMTQKFNILPPSTHDVGDSIGEARLGFNQTGS